MDEGTRLAEILAALSLASDLGIGAPLERGLRTCLVGMRLGELAGLDASDRRDLYYTGFLSMLGCTTSSTHEAELFGDELAMGQGMSPVIMGSQPQLVAWLVRNVGAGEPILTRAARVARVMRAGPAQAAESTAGHCEFAQIMAERLALGPAVKVLLGGVFERWDGAGRPLGLKGEAVPLPNRLGAVAYDLVVHDLLGLDPAMSAQVLKSHAGHGLDPAAVELATARMDDLVSVLRSGSPWQDVLDLEPEPRRLVDAAGLDRAAEIIADFTDLKSRYTRGHSRGVAALSVSAAEALGVRSPELEELRRAALAHDLGRVTVSAAIWDREGPLGDSEWEQVRLHPHWTERVLTRTQALAGAGRLAGLHHERLDGSGYHRGAGAATLPLAARILAAADVCQALGEERPHRPALGLPERERILASEVETGRLDGEVVAAVSAAAGMAAPTGKAPAPAGLTERELDVLRLVARGLATKEVASRLGVSVKTADHHLQRVYDKVGVRTRAGVTVFAVERGLVR